MAKQDKLAIVDGLRRLAADVTDLAALLEGSVVPTKEGNALSSDPAPEIAGEASAKAYAYEEVRAILAEKARTVFRAEVKALLTAHGVDRLSDVKDPAEFASIVKEAEVIGNG